MHASRLRAPQLDVEFLDSWIVIDGQLFLYSESVHALVATNHGAGEEEKVLRRIYGRYYFDILDGSIVILDQVN